MKNFIFTFIVCILFFSCKNEGCTDPLAINFDESHNKEDGSCDYLYDLDVRFSLTNDNVTLSKNDIISFDDNSFRVEKFKVYLSDFSINTSSGFKNLNDVYLFDLEDENTHSLEFTLSEKNISEFNFNLGLNETLNTTNPADYSTGHPLGIDNGTYWPMGNSNSYIFVMIFCFKF